MITEYDFEDLDYEEEEDYSYLVKGNKPSKDTISKKFTRQIMDKPIGNKKYKVDRTATLRRKEVE